LSALRGAVVKPCSLVQAGLRSASAAAAAASRLSLIPTELDSRRVQFLLSVTRHFSFVYALSLPHAAHFIHARTLRQYSALEVKSKGRPVDPDGPVLISGGSMWAAMAAIAPPPQEGSEKYFNVSENKSRDRKLIFIFWNSRKRF